MNQINTVQFESHTTENRATVAENEAFKWKTKASRYQEELQEIKELLSSTRTIKRDSIFGFDRRASLHDGKGRGHRLASSLSNVVGLDEMMEERIILCSDANDRFARPKTNEDPYIEFTDLRKLIEVPSEGIQIIIRKKINKTREKKYNMVFVLYLNLLLQEGNTLCGIDS